MNKINKQSPNLQQDVLNQLKQAYPPLFNDEGNLDEQELHNLMQGFASTSSGKYQFNWAGKMNAKRNAYRVSRANLKPDKSRSIDFDTTQNAIIEGDNLEVLKLLQKSYFSKIKAIYIDPPYNTGKDFVYSDNFTQGKQAYWEQTGATENGVKLDTNTESHGRYHSNWLNMIYPRLLLARNLLREDGVIFVSIDDHEVHNLRKVMDEVFGEENFLLEQVINKPSEIASNYIISKHEYVIVYTKTQNLKLNFPTKYTISRGTVGNIDQTMPVIRFPAGLKCENIKDGTYIKTRQKKNSKENIENFSEIVVENGKLKYPIRLKARWRSSNDMRNFFANNCKLTKAKISGYIEKVYFKGDTFNPQIKKLTYEKISSLFLDNKRGSKKLEELNLKNIFENPKSVDLLSSFVKLLNSNDIILDFFAGSGTTAHAVMDLNKQDGGNRKYILVQLPEKTDDKSEAYKAGYKTISDICIERVKRVSDNIRSDYPDLDLGFKVFSLTKSYFPENLFTPDPDKTEAENTQALTQYIEQAEKQLEFEFDENYILYEILLKDGFQLNFQSKQLKEFKNNKVLQVTDNIKQALVCLDTTLDNSTLQLLNQHKDSRFICLERAVDTTKKWNLKKTLGRNLWVV